MKIKVTLFLIAYFLLLVGNMNASHERHEMCLEEEEKAVVQKEKSARIYYTSTSLITRLFQTLNALVAIYPDKDEHVLQYLGMLQKDIQERAAHKTLNGEILVHKIEGFENWLASYVQTAAGKKSKPLLADMIHITDRTMRVVRQQMTRERTLVGYQLNIVQGIETVYKTIGSLKELIRIYPYKDEHLAACLKRFEEEMYAKVEGKTLTPLAFVQMVESFHKWLLYYASITTDHKFYDLLKIVIHEWTRTYHYVVDRIGTHLGRHEQAATTSYYQSVALPVLACTTIFLLMRWSFSDKNSFVQNFFSTMNLEHELDLMTKKREGLTQEADRVTQRLDDLRTMLSDQPGDGGAAIDGNSNSFKQSTEAQILFVKTQLDTLTSLRQKFQDTVNSRKGVGRVKQEEKLKKVEEIRVCMENDWKKIETIMECIDESSKALTTSDTIIPAQVSDETTIKSPVSTKITALPTSSRLSSDKAQEVTEGRPISNRVLPVTANDTRLSIDTSSPIQRNTRLGSRGLQEVILEDEEGSGSRAEQRKQHQEPSNDGDMSDEDVNGDGYPEVQGQRAAEGKRDAITAKSEEVAPQNEQTQRLHNEQGQGASVSEHDKAECDVEISEDEQEVVEAEGGASQVVQSQGSQDDEGQEASVCKHDTAKPDSEILQNEQDAIEAGSGVPLVKQTQAPHNELVQQVIQNKQDMDKELSQVGQSQGSQNEQEKEVDQPTVKKANVLWEEYVPD